MGWLMPTELTTATTVTDMSALNDKPQAYLIRNNGYENEYYIVENRQQIGWDANLPGKGIIVFHIDYDPDLWISPSEYTNTPNRQHYLIIPANDFASTGSSNRWSYPYYYNNELTNTSTPAATLWNDNTDGTKLMSKPLTNMAVSGELASFDFMGGSTAVEQIFTSAREDKNATYNLAGQRVAGNYKGLVIINGRKFVKR
jgi:hypothetical protein